MPIRGNCYLVSLVINSIMKILIILTYALLIASCNSSGNNAKKPAVESAEQSKTNQTQKDTTISFLWLALSYDPSVKDSLLCININEKYCQNMSNQERAALGYVATFIGNECWWDGNATEDRSNLKCKILTALNLGYQCSEKHLGFLKQWFKNDEKSLQQLENCPTTPYTATIQESFDEIIISTKGNKIDVQYKVSGINSREEHTWQWTQTDHFEFDENQIKLIGTDKSAVKQGRL